MLISAYLYFLLLCFMIIYVLGFSSLYTLSFPLLGCMSTNILGLGVIDGISLICWLMLFICGATVIPFIFHYMGSFFNGWSLFMLICSFIGVMAILIFSGDYFYTLLGWEYLGLVSYLLIIYLCNMTSVRASLITLFASRFGDVALFVLTGFGLFYWDCGFLLSLCILLVVFTKSACFPFTSWLLEAMRAPTPVSCLVHSSTLVAAGVWFSLRYNFFFGDSVREWLMVFSVYSILLTGASALFVVDLKKLVALSTCNNIAWCVLCFSLGDVYTCILFLFTHGVSKCLLFILVGDVMSSSGGSQSGFGVYSARYSGRWNTGLSVILLSCLSGLPYMGVFLSKHVLLGSSSLCYSSFFYLLCCLCVSLSFAYTYRFVFLLLNRLGGLGSGVSLEFGFYCFICFLPSILNFVGSAVYLDVVPAVSFFSVASLFFWIHFIGFMTGLLFYGFLVYLWSGSVWSYSLFGCDFIVGMFYSLGSKITALFYTCCVRWEVFFLRWLLDRFFQLFRYSFLGGINLCVVGLFWILFFLSIFYIFSTVFNL